MPQIEPYRIEIDGEWSLNDLPEFPYAYTQAYSFLYALAAAEVDDDERLRITFTAHPWTGGFSSVNFFRYLYYLIPRPERPAIISMRYSSPGWIDLSLVLAIGMALRKIVGNVCDATLRINDMYTALYKGAQDRKLLSLNSKSAELKLDREHLEFLEKSAETFAKILGFEHLEQLNKLAPNPLATLKMMFAFYRKVRKLKEYQDKKKLKL